MREGVAFDLHDVADPALVQSAAELTAVAVAGIGYHQWQPQPLPDQLIEHLHRHHPLRTMALLARDLATVPSRGHLRADGSISRLVIP